MNFRTETFNIAQDRSPNRADKPGACSSKSVRASEASSGDGSLASPSAVTTTASSRSPGEFVAVVMSMLTAGLDLIFSYLRVFLFVAKKREVRSFEKTKFTKDG